MKKIAAILLILVYGMSSSGMSVTADYCCGKLSKLAVSLSQAENSKQDNQLANKQCCSHKELNFKVKAAHETTAKQNIDLSTQCFIHPAFFTVAYNQNFLNTIVPEFSTGPPLYFSSNLFLKNCSFRI